MKKSFLLFFFLIPIFCIATDINLQSGGDLTNAISKAQPGDNIFLAAGDYTINGNGLVKPKVNIRGAGIGQTRIYNYTYGWWKGAFELQGGDGQGQILEGFSLIGDPKRSFEGIHIHDRNNVTLRNVSVEKFFYSGIEIQSAFEKTMSGITVSNFSISESSKESTAGSFGNLILRGQLENIIIENGVITHKTNDVLTSAGEKSSGYGIKAFSNWANGDFSKTETQSNVKVSNIKFYGKENAPWGGDVPNFSMEIWNVHVSEFHITKCFFSNQLSLEHGGQKDVARSFYVYDNDFDVIRGQSIELTASHSLVTRNRFKHTKNSNPWNFVGTYNSQANLKNITFSENQVDLGSHSPIILCVKGQYINLQMNNNVFTGSGSPVIAEFRSGSSGSTIIAKNNTMPKLLKGMAFNGVTANSVSFAFTPGPTTIPIVTNPDTPANKPPATPPNNTSSVSSKDTIYKTITNTITIRDSLIFVRQGDSFSIKVITNTKTSSSTSIDKKKIIL